jgi:hypothetical protein
MGRWRVGTGGDSRVPGAMQHAVLHGVMLRRTGTVANIALCAVPALREAAGAEWRAMLAGEDISTPPPPRVPLASEAS